MVITYGSTVLVSGGLEGVNDFRINGEQVSEEAMYFRASAGVYFSRGNKITEVDFGARWSFNTRGLAEKFILTHWASLATRDNLDITCGDGETTGQYDLRLANAVLRNVSLVEWRGTLVRMRYSFQGGLFASI